MLELEGRDKRARVQARLGRPVAASDTVTRRIKSNASRAHKRMVWAIDTFRSLRAGVSPTTIIDPETRRPLQAEATAAAPEPSQPAPAPSPPAADPDPSAALPPEDPIPLPDNVSGEDRELLLLMGATLRSLFRQGLLKPPGSCDKVTR